MFIDKQITPNPLFETFNASQLPENISNSNSAVMDLTPVQIFQIVKIFIWEKFWSAT